VVPPLLGVRWLSGAEDEARLIGLLRACYGDTYSHRGLYLPGAFQALWSAGGLASLGDFDEAGALRGHTGLWFKDPQGDFVESGLSLVAPAARQGRRRAGEAAVWPWLLQQLTASVALVHQHTTTLHKGAQLYALRYMGARLSGFIPTYTMRERLVGLHEGGATMHALMMTTLLRPLPEERRTILIPPGQHAEWLTRLALELGLLAGVVAPAAPAAARLTELERSSGLGLLRRRATVDRGAPPLIDAGARVELIHLPAQEEELATLSGPLYEAGYLPVGLRLGVKREHEILWWRGALPPGLLAQMALVRPAWEEIIEAWSELTAHLQ
jgi:hypothetical protein